MLSRSSVIFGVAVIISAAFVLNFYVVRRTNRARGGETVSLSDRKKSASRDVKLPQAPDAGVRPPAPEQPHKIVTAAEGIKPKVNEESENVSSAAAEADKSLKGPPGKPGAAKKKPTQISGKLKLGAPSAGLGQKQQQKQRVMQNKPANKKLQPPGMQMPAAGGAKPADPNKVRKLRADKPTGKGLKKSIA